MKSAYAIPIGILGFLLLALSMAKADDTTVNANVTGYLDVTFNYDTVTYGSLTSPSANNTAPGTADGVYNVSVDTNQNFKVEASGTQFDDGGGHTFPVSNLRFDTDTVAGSLSAGNGKSLTGSAQTIDTGIAYTTTDHYHGYYLSIPDNQFSAAYSSTVTITYSAV